MARKRSKVVEKNFSELVEILGSLGITVTEDEITTEYIQKLLTNQEIRDLLGSGLHHIETLSVDENTTTEQLVSFLTKIMKKNQEDNAKENDTNEKQDMFDQIDGNDDDKQLNKKLGGNEKAPAEDKGSKNKIMSAGYNITPELLERLQQSMKETQEGSTAFITAVCSPGKNLTPEKGIISEEKLKAQKDKFNKEEIIKDLVKIQAVVYKEKVNSKGEVQQIVVKGQDLLDELDKIEKFFNTYKPGTPVEVQKPKDLMRPLVGFEVTENGKVSLYTTEELSKKLIGIGGSIQCFNCAHNGITLYGVKPQENKNPGEVTKYNTVVKKTVKDFAVNNTIAINVQLSPEEAKKDYGREYLTKSANTVHFYHIVKEVTSKKTGLKELKLTKVHIKCEIQVPFEKRASQEYLDKFHDIKVLGVYTPLSINNVDDANKLIAVILANQNSVDPNSSVGKVVNEIIAANTGTSGKVDAQEEDVAVE